MDKHHGVEMESQQSTNPLVEKHKQLDEALAVAGKRLAELRQRLETVLRPELPEPARDEMPKQPTAERSPLRQRMDSTIEVARSLDHFVVKLLGRIDL